MLHVVNLPVRLFYLQQTKCTCVHQVVLLLQEIIVRGRSAVSSSVVLLNLTGLQSGSPPHSASLLVSQAFGMNFNPVL